MTKEERMDAMERLWESFARDGMDLPSPAWHEEILHERTSLADSPSAEWLSIDELQDRLLKK